MSNIQICCRCIMNSTVSDINFTDSGCNYCDEFVNKSKLLKQLNGSTNGFEKIAEKIRSSNKKYDCVVGLSGGVDSSFVLVKVVEMGFRPLAVHMDNGWNTELAQSNIYNLVKKLNVDLETHVIDWGEYKGMLDAFIKSNVVDLELLYDNAMVAVNYNMANRYNIKYILSGSNTATEGFRMPPGWNWFKYDALNIRSIVKAHSYVKIRTFPLISIWKMLYFNYVKGIKWISFLDSLNYSRAEALEVLTSKFDYKPYPYKHYESIFTRFYQGIILPRKFKIDKRLLHLSNLVISGEITRDQALKIMETPTYPSLDLEKNDINYFVKKMGYTHDYLSSYLGAREESHLSYKSSLPNYNRLLKFVRFFKKKLGLV